MFLPKSVLFIITLEHYTKEHFLQITEHVLEDKTLVKNTCVISDRTTRWKMVETLKEYGMLSPQVITGFYSYSSLRTSTVYLSCLGFSLKQKYLFRNQKASRQYWQFYLILVCDSKIKKCRTYNALRCYLKDYGVWEINEKCILKLL